jgi:PmbA protein
MWRWDWRECERPAAVRAAELAGRAVASAGPDALAFVTRERSLMLRFAGNRPTQSTAIDDVTIELAVLRHGHVGRATTNAADDEALRDCARRAAAAAEAAAAAGDGTFAGFPQPQAAARHDGHDAETARLEPEAGAAALAAAFEVARTAGLEAHGIWTAAEQERAVATSGAAVAERTTDAFMKVICVTAGGGDAGAAAAGHAAAAASAGRAAGAGPGGVAGSAGRAAGGRSGYAAQAAVSAGRIDARALSERAAAKAAAGGMPAELEAGDYPVVFEAHAVGWLCDLLAGMAFNGLAHVEGRGALVGRLGHKVAAPAMNLSDAPGFPGTLPRGFDAEGVAKAPLPLIEDGVAHSVVHDLRSAAVAGARSTGHALAPGGHPYGPHPTNLVLAGGGADDEAELCSQVKRGIYVTRLWYANVVRPKETLITAVTRDGTFLIENGRITRPVRDLRLTDSVLDIFSRTRALTRGLELTSDGEFYGRRSASGVVCPALLAGAVRFTGPSG